MPTYWLCGNKQFLLSWSVSSNTKNPQNIVYFFPSCVQRWTSRAWSSRLLRQTAWTASATARRRTSTASRAAPVTTATRAHIPTDCSHTTVRPMADIHLSTSFLTHPRFPHLIPLPPTLPLLCSPTPPTTYTAYTRPRWQYPRAYSVHT